MERSGRAGRDEGGERTRLTLVEGEGLGLVVGVLSACCNNSLDPLFVLRCLPFSRKVGGEPALSSWQLPLHGASAHSRFPATPIEPWLATVK